MIVVSLIIGIGIFRTPAMGFLSVTLMQIPRVYYSMAEDRPLPAAFQKVNSKTQTQAFGLLFLGGIILASIFLLGTFENIVNYVMFLDTMTLAIVSSSISGAAGRASSASSRASRSSPAGEWPQETGQSHGQDRVSLERRDEARLERENHVRKRQQVLTLSGENGKLKGTDTARLPPYSFPTLGLQR